jgi:hypothetical protein
MGRVTPFRQPPGVTWRAGDPITLGRDRKLKAAIIAGIVAMLVSAASATAAFVVTSNIAFTTRRGGKRAVEPSPDRPLSEHERRWTPVDMNRLQCVECGPPPGRTSSAGRQASPLTTR